MQMDSHQTHCLLSEIMIVSIALIFCRTVSVISATNFCLKLYWHESCWHYRRRCYNERSTTNYSREHMYNRCICIHHCSLSYCKRRNHIFFNDSSQFYQYGYQLFYKRYNNTAARSEERRVGKECRL